MKRLIPLLLLFVIAASSTAIAQEVTNTDEATPQTTDIAAEQTKNLQTIRYKHDLRLTYGAPGLTSWIFLDDSDWDKPISLAYPDHIDPTTVTAGRAHALMTLGLGYSYQLTPLISLGAKTTFATLWQHSYDNVTNVKVYSHRYYNISALADVRFSWLRRENIELYSSLSLGAMLHIAPTEMECVPMLDVALIGVTFGRSLYGFVEVGGLVGGSVRAGLGYRFNGKK